MFVAIVTFPLCNTSPENVPPVAFTTFATLKTCDASIITTSPDTKAGLNPVIEVPVVAVKSVSCSYTPFR